MGMCSEYEISLNENQPEVGPRLLKALEIISGLLGECCPAVVITDALQLIIQVKECPGGVERWKIHFHLLYNSRRGIQVSLSRVQIRGT